MRLPSLSPRARIWLVCWIVLGFEMGCGVQKADQPTLAPTPEGVELLKPDPNPPKKDPNGS
jgi:hypothetical protein